MKFTTISTKYLSCIINCMLIQSFFMYTYCITNLHTNLAVWHPITNPTLKIDKNNPKKFSSIPTIHDHFMIKNALIQEGRTKWRNCRLTNKHLDYQLGWALLAECMQLDTHKCNFHFMQWKFFQPYLLHNIKGTQY